MDDIATDPAASRSLWEFLLAESINDTQVSAALNEVLASAVVDYITNNMAKSDEYASVIGRRIATLMRVHGLRF